jgi:hypothetical protein
VTTLNYIGLALAIASLFVAVFAAGQRYPFPDAKFGSTADYVWLVLVGSFVLLRVIFLVVELIIKDREIAEKGTSE